MTLVGLIVILILVGVGLYAINSIMPIDAKIKKIINVIVIIAVCLWLLDIFVGIPHIGNYKIGR